MRELLDGGPGEAAPVIWACPEPWRDLRADLARHPKVTALTTAGALVHIDWARQLWSRHSLGKQLPTDGLIRIFEAVRVATPCGLWIVGDHPDDFYFSSHLAVAVEGLHTFDHPAFLPAMRANHGGERNDRGHPPKSCGARSCEWADRLTAGDPTRPHPGDPKAPPGGTPR